MSEGNKLGFLCHFDELEDPRIDKKKLYPLGRVDNSSSASRRDLKCQHALT